MVHYRRAKMPGACYFLTLALRDRASDLLVRHRAELGDACVIHASKSPIAYLQSCSCRTTCIC